MFTSGYAKGDNFFYCLNIRECLIERNLRTVYISWLKHQGPRIHMALRRFKHTSDSVFRRRKSLNIFFFSLFITFLPRYTSVSLATKSPFHSLSNAYHPRRDTSERYFAFSRHCCKIICDTSSRHVNSSPLKQR